MKTHRRTPSDIEFKELMRRDALAGMHRELQKLVQTTEPENQDVIILFLLSNIKEMTLLLQFIYHDYW